MPEQYDNTNRGILFENDKEGNEKRPDFTGRVNITAKPEEFEQNKDGTVSVTRKISAWSKESKAGQNLVQIAVGERTEND